MTELLAIFPAKKLKTMMEILLNIERNIHLTITKDFLCFESQNPFHHVSASLFFACHNYQFQDAANFRWTGLLDLMNLNSCLHLVHDNDHVQIIASSHQISFLFYNMGGELRFCHQMIFQRIVPQFFRNCSVMRRYIDEAEGYVINLRCTEAFKEVLRNSIIQRRPVDFVRSDIVLTVSSGASSCDLVSGVDFLANGYQRTNGYLSFRVSLYEASYILTAASLAQQCTCKVIINERLALALPLLMSFTIERELDQMFVDFTILPSSVVQPTLMFT